MSLQVYTHGKRFKEGDLVFMKCELFNGLGRVALAAYPSPNQKGEMGYGWRMDKPFPQVVVRPTAHLILDAKDAELTVTARRLLFDGGDLKAGKLKLLHRPDNYNQKSFDALTKMVNDRKKDAFAVYKAMAESGEDEGMDQIVSVWMSLDKAKDDCADKIKNSVGMTQYRYGKITINDSLLYAHMINEES